MFWYIYLQLIANSNTLDLTLMLTCLLDRWLSSIHTCLGKSSTCISIRITWISFLRWMMWPRPASISLMLTFSLPIGWSVFCNHFLFSFLCFTFICWLQALNLCVSSHFSVAMQTFLLLNFNKCMCDVVVWLCSQTRSTMRDYGSSVATRGILYSNTRHTSVGFRPLHKPNWLLVNKNVRNFWAAMFCICISLIAISSGNHELGKRDKH